MALDRHPVPSRAAACRRLIIFLALLIAALGLTPASATAAPTSAAASTVTAAAHAAPTRAAPAPTQVEPAVPVWAADPEPGTAAPPAARFVAATSADVATSGPRAPPATAA